MADAPAPSQDLVEDFRPTSGYWLGWAGVVGFGVLAAVSLAGSRSLPAVATAAGFAWAALLMWVGLVRPRVVAHGDYLLLRNEFRDTLVPWHLIDGIVVRHTLRVYVDDKVVHGAAVSRSLRAIRAGGRAPPRGGGLLSLGAERMVADLVPNAPPEQLPQMTDDYPGYVETRLRELASERAEGSQSLPAVTTRWALVETVVFVLVTVVAVGLIVASF